MFEKIKKPVHWFIVTSFFLKQKSNRSLVTSLRKLYNWDPTKIIKIFWYFCFWERQNDSFFKLNYSKNQLSTDPNFFFILISSSIFFISNDWSRLIKLQLNFNWLVKVDSVYENNVNWSKWIVLWVSVIIWLIFFGYHLK